MAPADSPVTRNSVTGLSAGAITYTAAPTALAHGVRSVTINGGHGANTFNVLSTAAFAPVSIVGGAGSNDLVRIGSPVLLTGRTLANIAGNVNVSNALGKTKLILDDSAD